MQEILDAQKETRYPSPVKVGALMGVVGVFISLLIISNVIWMDLVLKYKWNQYLDFDFFVAFLLFVPVLVAMMVVGAFGNPNDNLLLTIVIAGVVAWEMGFLALWGISCFVDTSPYHMGFWNSIGHFALGQFGNVGVTLIGFFIWLFFGLGRQVSNFKNKAKSIELNREIKTLK